MQELALRFRSVAMAGLMLRMDSQVAAAEMAAIVREHFAMCRVQEAGDSLELGLEAGRVRVRLVMGDQEKQVRGDDDDGHDDDDDDDGQVVVGQSLNDDIWHTVSIRRRGNTIEASVDDEESKKGE